MTARTPEAFSNAVRELARLPGIGGKTAERLVFHLLARPGAQVRALADALAQLKDGTRECRICHNLTDGELCGICRREQRRQSSICVVEMPQDLFKIEDACDYDGTYHVLGGRYAPLEGVFPEDLNIDTLVRRVRTGGVEEVILALNPNTEGEATAGLVAQALRGCAVRISRLATGMSHGSDIEWTGRHALQDAFRFRRDI